MHDAAEFEDCARRLKALADPERLKIVDPLFAGPRNVTDLAAELGQEVVNVSHHLGVLKNADLVRGQRQGRFIVYSLAPDVIAAPPKTSSGECCRQLDLGCCSLEIATDLVKLEKKRK
jgi:DNA-binding transcriptional ArsR family regulator